MHVIHRFLKSKYEMETLMSKLFTLQIYNIKMQSMHYNTVLFCVLGKF